MAPPIVSDPLQPSFEDLDETLRDVTFVVVDLETTGGAPGSDAITEIGAVKVRGGEVLGEFATLVDPLAPIAPRVVMLTGITDAMVHDAPRLDAVLPAFLEFARGCVLVAHNAPFDIGFLRAACAARDIPWPRPPVVDTVRLARAVLPRSEVPSVRLGVLAGLFSTRTQPDHRALNDARATVDVLHGLLERVGPLGVASLADIQSLGRRPDPERRRKRHLADGIPASPGVYLFRGPNDEVLYVGTSNNLARRVRSYFTATEKRAKMRDMLRLATRIDHVVCTTPLEARVREQRLIRAHRPPYNTRSKNPGKTYWIKPGSAGRWKPSVTSACPAPGVPVIGPFFTMAHARQAASALDDVLRSTTTPTGRAEPGRADVPRVHAQLATLASGESSALLERAHARLGELAEAGHYARAAALRDALAGLLEALIRQQRLAAFAAIAEIIAADRDTDGGWEIAIVRYGRLSAAARADRGVDPYAVIDTARATAESVRPAAGPLPGASAEETLTTLSWCERPGVRLVMASSPWALPVGGAGRWTGFAAAARAARDGYDQTGSDRDSDRW